MNEWHYPSKGEYPTDQTETLNLYKYRGELKYDVDVYSRHWNAWMNTAKVIAWMPLPDPPKEEA